MTGKVPVFPPCSVVSSALPGYLVLGLILQVHRLEAEFKVIGPDHPVAASLSGVAILSCHLSPKMSAENMEVRWFRASYSSVVHLYLDRQDQYRGQMPEYQGRTELLKDDITSGRVSLKIRDIQPSDNGQYTCYFQSDIGYEEALLELQVAGLGSAPAISMEGHQDGGLWVVCRSAGWYPQPEAEWRDHQGQRLPPASEKTSQEASGLFQTEIAMVLTEVSNRKVSCRIRNPRLTQEKESVISIAELFFPRTNPWMVSVWVSLALLAVLIGLASYCFWRQHHAKETLQSARKSEKETLLSDWKEEKEKLRSAMKQQKADYEAMKELGLMRARGYAGHCVYVSCGTSSNPKHFCEHNSLWHCQTVMNRPTVSPLHPWLLEVGAGPARVHSPLWGGVGGLGPPSLQTPTQGPNAKSVALGGSRGVCTPNTPALGVHGPPWATSTPPALRPGVSLLLPSYCPMLCTPSPPAVLVRVFPLP